ncbi:hypothetical protein, partial [Francisella philomiragia]
IEKGQKKLDEKKFMVALKHHYRLLLKTLIERAQSNGVKYLNSPNMLLRWQDHFSRGIIDYQSAHAESLSLFAPLCKNPHELDASLSRSVLPEDTVELKTYTDVTSAMPSTKLAKVTITQYSLDGYSILKTETIFDKDSYIDSCSTNNPKITTTDVTDEVKNKFKEPKGFKWLDDYVISTGGVLHDMFFPSDDSDEYDYKNKELKADAKGKYNRNFIGQGNIALSLIVDDGGNKFDAYKDKIKDKVLEEANKYINNGRFALTVHNFTDGFLGVINKRPKGTYKKI